MNSIFQVLNFGFWVGQEAPIQDKQRNFGHCARWNIKFILIKDWIHTNDISFSQNLELTDFIFFIFNFDFNLTINYEIYFVTLLVLLDELGFFFNFYLSHLILNFVEKHCVVFKIVSFKIFDLLEQLDFEFLKAICVVVRILP